MSIDKFNEFWKEPEAGDMDDTSNQIPDGEYVFRIDMVGYYPKPEKNTDYISVNGTVVGGDYEGSPVSNLWVIKDHSMIKKTIGDLFMFAKACEIELSGPGDFVDEGIRKCFENRVVKASMKTNGNFKNWKYWTNAGEDAQVKTDIDNINLDEDPFKAEEGATETNKQEA